MAVLEFTEYRYPRAIYGALPPLVNGQEVATQQVAVGAASEASDPFDERTQFILLVADVDCRIAFGAAAVASNEAPFTRKIAANSEYSFAVEPGQVLAVIEMEA